MSIAGTFGGSHEEFVVIDNKEFNFFKEALGWDDDHVEESRKIALRHFKSRFGLDASDAVLEEGSGVYVLDGLTLFAFAFDFPFYKIADSAKLVDCPTAMAVWGGWALEGSNVTLSGEYGGVSGVQIPADDEAIMISSYMVFAPGSQYSTIVEVRSRKPLACAPLNAICGISDTMNLLDDFHDPYPGYVDGSLNFETSESGNERVVARFTLTWPGRF
eukprot:CAMPEP_0198359164 /NCGR_PEP_ID=MMETSP1450-20131203/133607_1 /TAXON_ID=753684 ORGANISM="Madagascaria erythrocladiodes, Strain CCMP3234" /NCGR_SAMPLE_ID=MMETSP1450 /ASSEMBLY_ACC=CAM_ASM_001115 /LENGTH=216 /DNA_ID=CAMNT_0044066013 /DNA_START=12 /DNA_END=662 /DNA_ORIENTATION=-